MWLSSVNFVLNQRKFLNFFYSYHWKNEFRGFVSRSSKIPLSETTSTSPWLKLLSKIFFSLILSLGDAAVTRNPLVHFGLLFWNIKAFLNWQKCKFSTDNRILFQNSLYNMKVHNMAYFSTKIETCFFKSKSYTGLFVTMMVAAFWGLSFCALQIQPK